MQLPRLTGRCTRTLKKGKHFHPAVCRNKSTDLAGKRIAALGVSQNRKAITIKIQDGRVVENINFGL